LTRQRVEIEAVSDLIKAEVNVKEILFLDDASGVLVKANQANFKTWDPVWKRYGFDFKEIQGFQRIISINWKAMVL
jgi:isoleucyl-tRNA synthetase